MGAVAQTCFFHGRPPHVTFDLVAAVGRYPERRGGHRVNYTSGPGGGAPIMARDGPAKVYRSETVYCGAEPEHDPEKLQTFRPRSCSKLKCGDVRVGAHFQQALVA